MQEGHKVHDNSAITCAILCHYEYIIRQTKKGPRSATGK